MAATLILLRLLLTAITLSRAVISQAIFEPADGTIALGFWINTAHGTVDEYGGDTPKLFNARLGRNAAIFSIKQNIPATNNSQILANNLNDVLLMKYARTDAILLLHVFPSKTFQDYTDDDIMIVANQVKNWTTPISQGGFGRRVLIRFAWEMNGDWYQFGLMPQAYVAAWRHFVTMVKGVVGEGRVGFIWAPNHSVIQPYAIGSRTYVFGDGKVKSADDFKALDTNGDGVIDNKDDPYTAYYPGDDVVDWVGMSIYNKPIPSFNTPAPDGLIDMYLTSKMGVQNPAYNFYNMFCVGRNKPFIMPEGGGPYYPDVPGGADQLTMVSSYWRTFITNATFLNAFPKIKMINYFEFKKLNEDNQIVTLRDYRITNVSSITAQFLQDIAPVESRFLWANTVDAKGVVVVAGNKTTVTATVSVSGGGRLPAQVTSTSTKKSGGVVLAASSRPLLAMICTCILFFIFA